MENKTQCFEGSEKKIDITLVLPSIKLRSKKNRRWEKVVEACGAKIISKIETEQVDAYLLSESSLFLWDNRILIITCGTTALYKSFPEIMKFIKEDQIGSLSYERKNLVYPERQLSNFEREINVLEGMFKGKNYRLGSATNDHFHLFHYSRNTESSGHNPTLQILMHDLDTAVINFFTNKNWKTGADINQISGLDHLFPGFITDSYLFSPYGYSLNGIMGKHYITVHVTPQISDSYASFETNLIFNDYVKLIERISFMFKPRRFSTIFRTKGHHMFSPLNFMGHSMISNYEPLDKITCEFDHGNLFCFVNYAIKSV